VLGCGAAMLSALVTISHSVWRAVRVIESHVATLEQNTNAVRGLTARVDMLERHLSHVAE
jgi:hypothetical protein